MIDLKKMIQSFGTRPSAPHRCPNVSHARSGTSVEATIFGNLIA